MTRPHLCSFKEYILAFFSCISWDFSEFAALLSMLILQLFLLLLWLLSLSLQSVCVPSERKQKRRRRRRSTGDFFFFFVLSPEDAARSCRVAENRQVRSPSMFSLDAGKSQPRPHPCEQRGFRTERINSFIAAREQERERRGGRWREPRLRGGF